MNNIIEVVNLTKLYGETIALNNVSFSIPEGSIFAILGPNGAGKTTFLRILTQITLPTSGSILFKGQALSQKHLKLIGYLPEERGLYTKWKVSEHLLYFAQLYGLNQKQAKEQAKNWLERFDLLDRWNSKINELSKGMQQKIQFIISLIHNPQLIILDEPFSGFDPVNQQIIKQLILQLKHQQKTIILSTHIMSSVEELADYLLFINKGKVYLYGKVRDIKEQFSENIYLVELRESQQISDSRYWQVLENISDKVYKLKFQVSANLALSELLKLGEVERFERLLPSIEQLFFKIVKSAEDE